MVFAGRCLLETASEKGESQKKEKYSAQNCLYKV
jgi:hypothetical protein